MTTRNRTRTRGLTRVTWSVEEKELMYACFAYSRSERWSRNKSQIFEEQLRKSSLDKEKLKLMTIQKLNSLMSQISKYIGPERLEEMKNLGLRKAEEDYNKEMQLERSKRKTGWLPEENWTLLWATELAKGKYSNKSKEYTKLWRSIMEKHCPTRSNHKNTPSQLFNVKKRRAFSDHMTYLAEKVKLYIEGEIDPL